MKYRVDEILFFKPSYSLELRCCRICQVIKYLEKTHEYLVVTHDIYCPCHYYKSIVKEEDLEYIIKSFVFEICTMKEIKITISLSETMKLDYLDLYSEV